MEDYITEQRLIDDILRYFKNTLSSQKTIERFTQVLFRYKYGLPQVEVTEIKTDISPEDILNAVSLVMRMDIESIRNKSREKNGIMARQIYCHLATEITTKNQDDISELVNRDRTTLINSLRNHKENEWRKKKGIDDHKNYFDKIKEVKYILFGEDESVKIENEELCHTEQQ